MPKFPRLGGSDEADRGRKISSEVDSRGSADLNVEAASIPKSDKAKVYRGGREVQLYLSEETQVTSNYPVTLEDDMLIFDPKEGRENLRGGEARVAVVDCPTARVVMILRPAERTKHVSQDAIGVSILLDQSGDTRIGAVVADGKTKVRLLHDLNLPDYIPAGEEKTFYSRSEFYASLVVRHAKDAALNLGRLSSVATRCLADVDEVKAISAARAPYGMAVAQVASIRLSEKKPQEVEVLNIGAEKDLGVNVLAESKVALRRMGNSTPSRKGGLEVGKVGTFGGYDEASVLSATKGADGGKVAVVPEQVLYMTTDGFKEVDGKIRVGDQMLTLEQFLCLPPDKIIDVMQSRVATILENPQAREDDGAFLAVIPKRVLARNGVDYYDRYGRPRPTPRVSEQLPVEVVDESPAIVPTLSQAAASPSVPQLMDEATPAPVVADQAAEAGPLPVSVAPARLEETVSERSMPPTADIREGLPERVRKAELLQMAYSIAKSLGWDTKGLTGEQVQFLVLKQLEDFLTLTAREREAATSTQATGTAVPSEASQTPTARPAAPVEVTETPAPITEDVVGEAGSAASSEVPEGEPPPGL